MTEDMRAYHEEKVKIMLGKLCHVDRLVVQSMPFGALIDNETGKSFTPSITDPDIAYGIASAIKLVSDALVKRD